VRVAACLGCVLVLALPLAGCGGESGVAEDTGRDTVVAAFYPLAWAAERVVGDGVDVVNLTPAGAEPHDLELTPRDVEAVQNATLVLYLGGGFMPSLEDAVRGSNAALDLLGDENSSELDPHIWLDPVQFARVVTAIGGALGEPAAAKVLVAELEGLDTELRRGLATCERREIVTSHAAFGHLAAAYDLEQIALTGLSPEAEPAPRALEELVRQVEEVGATTVFFETLVSPEVAETVAHEAGVETAELDPLEGLGPEQLAAGDDYFSVMRDNLATLRQALGCR
jgi:zinc transport system substrate-binding protein